jgi:AraC-like DNA-binding protein
MRNKDNMEFWIFSLDDPDLYKFQASQAKNTSLYSAIYIQKCTWDFSAETKEILHLRNDCILLIDNYLIPIYYHLSLKGFAIILTEAFCEQDEIKVLLKLISLQKSPEGIVDLGAFNEEQKKCIDLIYQEYHGTDDSLRAPILRSLMLNLLLLSSPGNYSVSLKSGHLLNYALQFVDLVDQYAFQEKKKAFYANKIGITEQMLAHALQSIYHKTFREMIIYRILIEAIRLLVFTDKSITQIAHELNYDASDFNKLFLKWKGMHPKDLRISYRKLINYVENVH